MAQFNLAYKKMQHAEYGGKENLFLHYHNDEIGYTCGGIYQGANPHALDWGFIKTLHSLTNDIKRASEMLYADDETQLKVYSYFKKHYWDKSRLSELHDNKMAQEIYMASVLYGVPRAVKMAQKLCYVTQDGLIGDYTLRGLNNTDDKWFDTEYDKLEIELATSIAVNNNKEHYLQGWKNRAEDSWDINV